MTPVSSRDRIRRYNGHRAEWNRRLAYEELGAGWVRIGESRLNPLTAQ